MKIGTIVKIINTQILGIVVEEPLAIGGRYTIDTETSPIEAYEGELVPMLVWGLSETQLRKLVILMQKHLNK